jgi:hypothetical protein
MDLGKLPRFPAQPAVVVSRGLGPRTGGSELYRREARWSRLAPVGTLSLLRALDRRATCRRTHALAPEGSPDQPGHPIEQNGREPNGRHHQPRQRPLKALHRAASPSRRTGATLARDGKRAADGRRQNAEHRLRGDQPRCRPDFSRRLRQTHSGVPTIGCYLDRRPAANAMNDAEMDAEIEDFLEGFNLPTYRGMRINGVQVQTWSSKRGISSL